MYTRGSFFLNTAQLPAMKKVLLLLILSLFLIYPSIAQKTSISFGNNVTWFSDWSKRPFNLFNPEIAVSKKVKSNYILVSVDGFYGKIPAAQASETGDVYDRLIFTLKGNYALKSRNLLF